MDPSGEPGRQDWLVQQLSETQRLIKVLEGEPSSPKQRLALEQLARVQLRILQILSAGESPSSN